jgi:putative tricarboxylic transport membrane protein
MRHVLREVGIKKGFFLVLLSIVLIFSSACSSNDANTNTTTEKNTSTGTDASGQNAGSDSGEDSTSVSYPERAITLVVPFSAGGSVDRLARMLSDHWSKELGTPFVVENREGAGGQLGYTHFINSDPDGYTVLVGVEPYLSISILRGAKYSLDDFAFINVQQFDPVTITVRADSPYMTLGDLIEDIKNKPGELAYGTAAGGALQIVGRSFEQELGLDLREVTYDGGGDIRTALLAGEVDFITDGTTGDLSLGDEVRILGIASNEPFPAAPELPLLNNELKDYGVKIPNNGSSRLIAVQKEFKEKSPERYNKLLETYKATLENTEYRDALKKTNDEKITVYYGPEKSEALIHELFDTSTKYKDILLGGK